MTGSDAFRKRYYEFLKSPKWASIRCEILARADGRCELCGDETHDLIIHHTTYAFGWAPPPHCLLAVCEICHAKLHGRHFYRSWDGYLPDQEGD